MTAIVVDGGKSLKIETLFEGHEEANHHPYYKDVILHNLKQILPEDFFEWRDDDETTNAYQKGLLDLLMPLITYTPLKKAPGKISFFALSKFCSNSFKFFYEMITLWLVPEKRLNVVLVCASNFRLPEISDEVYSIIEIMIHVESEEEYCEIQSQFPIISDELVLGIQSVFQAQRIMDIKGTSADKKNRVEQKVHPVFMHRNEEEIMRNLIVLSDQIKFVRDIPQVFITFDEQANSELVFTVILVRVLKNDSCSVHEIFCKAGSTIGFIPDRAKIVGCLRKKYPIEATIFRLKLPKDDFLRTDHSIDLYKARQAVVEELKRHLGEIRDFNGGMISKQHELLSDIRNHLVDVKNYEELLLDNFFFSLSPVVMRSFVNPKAFKTLFMMLLNGIKEDHRENYYLNFHKESVYVYALVVTEDPELREVLQKAVQGLHIPSMELATAYTKFNGKCCIGYICWAEDPLKKEQLITVIQNNLRE